MKLEHPWVFLSGITVGGDTYVQIMAAADFDGVGVIANWRRDMNGGWHVWALNTEQSIRVDDFTDGQPIPYAPPLPALATSQHSDLALKQRALETAALAALHYLETPGDFIGAEKAYIIEDLDSALQDLLTDK